LGRNKRKAGEKRAKRNLASKVKFLEGDPSAGLGARVNHELVLKLKSSRSETVKKGERKGIRFFTNDRILTQKKFPFLHPPLEAINDGSRWREK